MSKNSITGVDFSEDGSITDHAYYVDLGLDRFHLVVNHQLQIVNRDRLDLFIAIHPKTIKCVPERPFDYGK